MTTRNTGNLLIFSSLLLILAMGLHPMGGSFKTILRISTVIIASHSIAIATIPFYLAGFRGLRNRLDEKNLFAVSAYYAVMLSLIAGMIAAAINGIALPLFVRKMNTTSGFTDSMDIIFRYGLSLNHAFDYIYIGGISLAVFCWSAAILQTKRLPAWLAYGGLTIVILFIVLFASPFSFLNLHGFRLIVLFIAVWIIAAGICMRRCEG
jgi:hypothetical protein